MELELATWRWHIGKLLRHQDDRTIKAHFGVCVESMVVIWHHICAAFLMAGMRGEHLLWILYFLKTYPTEDQGANFCAVT